jgi:zinc transport system substrate-binding protein
MSRLLLLLSLVASCVACSQPVGKGVQVVAGLYPMAYVAGRIAGDHATVTDLAKPGQEPHDLELGVQETARVTDADLVVYVKGLQPAVDDAVSQVSADKVEAISAAASGPRPVPVIDGDPHVWLDPRALAAVADAVLGRLVSLDPDHADDYRRNAARLQQDLAHLDRAFSAGLGTCTRRIDVVSHDAFAYLGRRYHIDFQSLVGLSPDAEPSPKHVAALQTLIDEQGLTTVFYEPLAGADPVRTLASDLGLQAEVLDPIEGLSDQTSGEDYLSLMRADLAALEKANGCSSGTGS